MNLIKQIAAKERVTPRVAGCLVRHLAWRVALAGWGSGVRSRADLLVRGSVVKGKEERRSEGPKPPAVGVSERLLPWMRQPHVA